MAGSYTGILGIARQAGMAEEIVPASGRIAFAGQEGCAGNRAGGRLLLHVQSEHSVRIGRTRRPQSAGVAGPNARATAGPNAVEVDRSRDVDLPGLSAPYIGGALEALGRQWRARHAAPAVGDVAAIRRP
jgi:hypothetical protein